MRLRLRAGFYSSGCLLFSVEFVAQQTEGEGAGAVDDLSAVGAALFEQGDRAAGACDGDPYRADGLFGRTARGACDAGGRDGVVGAADASRPSAICRATCSLTAP